MYTVLLVARDDGSPFRETQRYLTILVKDSDDNRPEFPKFSNCCTIPYDFSLMENLPTNQFVGQVSATDLDLGRFGIPKYKLEENGNTNTSFRIDENTGQIYSTRVWAQIIILQLVASNKWAQSMGTKLKPCCTVHY